MSAPVMVAMSGGVDSAVAAFLLREQSPAAGVTMRLAFEGAPESDEAALAAALCKQLNIPHFVADLGVSFHENVVKPFVSAYEQGLTPNPCVDCNKHIKFGALLDFARGKGYERFATGHYARVEQSPSGRFLLRAAKDLKKDQSYMLYTLSQTVFSVVEFPLGSLTKTEVREIARSEGFPMAEKGDSQDICFIPDGDYASFLERVERVTFKEGDFRSTAGEWMGRHRGIPRYTVGQRKGLGLSFGKPTYVVSKSAADNTVILGDEEDLFTTKAVAKHINLIPFDRLDAPMRVRAKVRYSQKAAPATVEQTGEDELTVCFDTPQRAISPGQSMVLYEEDYVIGGGKIC